MSELNVHAFFSLCILSHLLHSEFNMLAYNASHDAGLVSMQLVHTSSC